MEKQKKFKIVVVGNGFAGSKVAAEAAKRKDYEVTVVTPYQYIEISLLMTKVIAAGPNEHDKALYDVLQEPNVRYVHDTVTGISDGSLTTESGQVIEFDACVLAAGQHIPIFMPETSQHTKAARKAAVTAIHEQIVRAGTIVIGGSGPIGVEAAADIKLRFKDKKVVVVSSTNEILSMMGSPYRRLAGLQLDKIGIELISGERVESFEHGQVRLRSGRVVQADMYIPAFSTGGNCAFLPADCRDQRNYALVDDTFRVQRLAHVFAIGDCSSYDAIKTAPKIADQLPVLLYNLDASLHSRPLKHHLKGKTFEGRLSGPAMVALGHGVDDGYGVGPELPGCMGCCCWFLCGCQTPAGPRVAKMKTDFNDSVIPRLGKGISN